MTTMAIIFISFSVILQVGIGILTLIEAIGLKNLGASASSDKEHRRRK